MPAISRIRFTNVIYENGGKRYNDETFLFDGHNSAFLLENGGGKTVFIQTALQAIIPHINMAERKIKDTLSLENGPAHIAIEWIINEAPRRYAMTAVSLYIENNQLCSLKYTYDYDAQDNHGIEDIPFSISLAEDKRRPASRGEINDYYNRMNKQSIHANVFGSIQDYGKFIENTYKVIPSEWRKVAMINSGEGNVDEFFSKCKTTEQLLSNLLIPVIEEAIEGDHAIGFVETFERQRDHFKKNRILQDKIEQSHIIKDRIDAYVEVYDAYEKERLSLSYLKEEAKTVSNYVKNQLANKAKELEFNEDNQQLLKKDSKLYEQEKQSFDLYLLEEQSKEQLAKQKILQEKLNKEQANYNTIAARKQNIEMTSLQKDMSDEAQHIDLLEKELDTIEGVVEISDVKLQLAENSSNIKGQFVYELELIEREIIRISSDLKALQLEQSLIVDKRDASLSYEKDLIGQKSELEATIVIRKNNEERLMRQLVGEGPAVVTALQKDHLMTRKSQLVKDKSKYELRLEELEQYIGTKSNAKEALLEQKGNLKEQLSISEEQVKIIDKEMATLGIKVEEAGYPLLIQGPLYSKESSIIRELEEQREVAYNLKEKAIRDERIRLRQFDIYEDLSFYMSEPILEGIVTDLKASYDFVELGTQYVSTLKSSFNIDSDTLFNRHPFWSLTVVTSVKHMDKVRQTLADHRHELTHMIIVISREEANKLAQGTSEDFAGLMAKAIIPEEWKTGLEPDRYYEWQQSLRDGANEAISHRKQTEVKFSACNQLLELAREFFATYTYEDYEGSKGLISGCKTELKQVIADLVAIDRGIKEDQDSLIKVNNALNAVTLERERVAHHLQIIELMEAEGKEIETTERQLTQVIKALDNQEEQLESYVQDLASSSNRHKALVNEQYKFIGEQEKIIGLELYQEVKDYEPYGTNSSLQSLKEQRLIIKNTLSGLSRTRSEIEDRLNEHRQLLERYTLEFNSKNHEAKFPYVKVESYYDGESGDLFDQLVAAEALIEQKNLQLRRGEKMLTQINTRIQVVREALNNHYGGVVKFDVESEHIEQRLKIQKATLSDRSRKLMREKHQLEDQLHQYDITYRELEIKDAAFHYMASDVMAMSLEVGYFADFDEAPDQKVREMLHALEGQYVMTQKQLKQVKNKQESVMTHCQKNITDRRLLETLATGLSSNNSYKDLLIYQEKMTEIIMKIIKVAEDDKRESDLELQTFLAHLLTYVKSVASELNVIQSKTRITVGDEVKQIFVFDVPEWEDDTAKIALRQYIDATIIFYEKESLHSEANDEQLRRSLSDRLSVMSLLEVVMEEQSIKIKCRKVSNDMKINKAAMTWESSNKWSGGEKWSKNMTLFLSILNYLAEKKQHLSPNQKRQRSVILDNPFGKASSDHVLKPVFMIAEKLGFQIIALTAHAEGKFISEYFPVVYSCRLRKTTDPSKQIMTNEKILNHTYLRENSPMTVMRMQEVEQISLF